MYRRESIRRYCRNPPACFNNLKFANGEFLHQLSDSAPRNRVPHTLHSLGFRAAESETTHFRSRTNCPQTSIIQKYKVLELQEIENMTHKELKKMFETRDYDRYGNIDRRKTINNPVTNKEHIGNNIKRIRNADDGYRFPKSVLKINKEINTNLHPTQKPVALLEYLIKTYTNENDTVLDNCMGSGSTGVACVNTNRNFIGIELDENYFNIAKERIEKE